MAFATGATGLFVIRGALRAGNDPASIANFLTKFDHDILPQLN